MYENIILIPYRKREKHLDYFIKNTVPLIREHLPNSKVVVVEQNEGKGFNRGKILNVGFKEYENKTNFFITHDVDINPTEKSLREYYNLDLEDNMVLGILTSPCNTLAPIVKISSVNIHKTNGFSNDIWGWGVEDKILQNRVELLNMEIVKKIKNTNKSRDDAFFKCFDDINDRKPIREIGYKTNFHYNYYHKLPEKEKHKLLNESGLNNLDYTIIERKQLDDIVELIKVDI
jgi:hypothetical protein